MYHHHRQLLRIIFALSFFSLSLSAQAFEGKVVSISDGDTISVMHDGVAEKIRLNGIDCPENGQAFGNKAKQFASDMVFGKIVSVKEHGKDKYGRTIGDVFLSDGKNLKKELIKAGFAWWYRQYSNDKELEQLEHEAKLSQKGLWADLNPVAPWDWRHNPNASGKSTPDITGTPTGETTPRGFQIYEGPRGGRYHYSPKSGKKVYEKKR